MDGRSRSRSSRRGAEESWRRIGSSGRSSSPRGCSIHTSCRYTSGAADGALFYVMPYVEGESLRARLAREGRLPVQEALGIAREVADALGFAHAHGVVHRDIKPENILLDGGHAVVTDFGVALAVGHAGDDGRLTIGGLVVGSPAYMSPEQAGGDPASTAAATSTVLAAWSTRC